MSAAVIAKVEGEKLREYVLSLSICDRRLFISDVVEAIGYPVNRKSFYNWEYGKCMIPNRYKQIIVKVAGVDIFSDSNDQDKQHIT